MREKTERRLSALPVLTVRARSCKGGCVCVHVCALLFCFLLNSLRELLASGLERAVSVSVVFGEAGRAGKLGKLKATEATRAKASSCETQEERGETRLCSKKLQKKAKGDSQF